MIAKFRFLLTGESKIIEADKKICESIYEVTTIDIVKRNIEALGIELEDVEETNVAQCIITKVENIACLTMNLGPFYKQDIFTSSARWEDFAKFYRNSLATKFGKLLTDTFYAAKINQEIVVAPRFMTIVV